MNRSKKKDPVLLFYQAFESDTFFRNDRYLKRIIRPIYNRINHTQKITGFDMWYRLLVKALRTQGYRVLLNDYSWAKKHPSYPIGILGYPQILDDWELPNPAILGPGLYDHPMLAPDLFSDPRFKLYLLTCNWMHQMFTPHYGNRCVQWHAGIDLQNWPDTHNHPKSIDVLIYDKIRWNRDYYEPSLLHPIIDFLDSIKLSHVMIRYKYYDHKTYRALLSQSKLMVFLCEHETQGMAYQEAMASNVPILAWENGWWLDPNRPKFQPEPVQATSVPYFSAECGERFQNINEFYTKFDYIWKNRGSYRPRAYVERELSLAGSAEIYMTYYRQIAREQEIEQLGLIRE